MNRFVHWLDTHKDRVSWSYLTMWVLGCLCSIFLTLVLYLRLGPYGGQPFVIDIMRYLPAGIFYSVFGITGLVFPFMLGNLILRNEEKRPGLHKIFESVCAVLVSLSLFYQHLDNEIQRFCNMHITPDFVRSYLISSGVPDALWDLLASDSGGSNVSLYLLSVPVIFLLIWFLLVRRISVPGWYRWWLRWGLWFVIFGCFVFLPAFLRTDLFGSKNRQAKVAPPFVLIQQAISAWQAEKRFPADIQNRLTESQALWKQYNHAPWEHIDAERPWLRHYTGTCAVPETQYNVILIVLESFRAHSLKLFNPEETHDVTPFINRFATSDRAAMYTHYYTNGHPTIGGFMAFHTGLYPHSNLTTAKAFTGNQMESFVSIMKKHGYESAFFAGADPDWDNQRTWLVRWYDKISYKPEHNETDRPMFHDAADWILHERDQSKPFMLTVMGISNHMPFNLKEEQFRVTDSSELKDKIYNTMHYDDDVVREFIESIQNEPWFENTIVVITGDHGMDLGDRGESPDYTSLREEAVHIPLIISGKDTRIPRGVQEQVASHVDLGPTILELVGICDDVNMQGHSLLDPDSNRPVFVYKAGRAAMYTADWSAYILENDDVMLFEGSDILQKNNVAEQHPDIAEKMRKQARDMSVTVDYGYINNLYTLP